VVSFPQVCPPKPCIHLSSPPYVLHASPISFFRRKGTASLILNLGNRRRIKEVIERISDKEIKNTRRRNEK